MKMYKNMSTKKETTNKNPINKLSATKGRAMLDWYGKRAPKSIEWFPAQEKEVYGDEKAKDWNSIFWGDNKQVLSHLLKNYRGKVDLIYIDPPFDSKADYVKKVKLNGQKLDGLDQGVIEQMQYTDMWEKDEYLQFMYERLIILRELLSDTGSIYLHCDWHKNSHLRLIMDEVFGEENLINEIVWSYRRWTVQSDSFQSMHDTIYFYVKNSKKYTYNRQKEDFSEKTQVAKYERKIVGGRAVQDKTKEMERDGEGVAMRDVWDISYLHPVAIDRTGYPTQKPKELLERIVVSSSNEGDLVMDCFMGSGTTCAVAQKLGRRFIGCDINKGAIITTTERLNKILEEQKKDKAFEDKEWKGLNTFKVYNVNHYDVFNNDIQAKELLIEAYKIEPLARGSFDGTLGADFVKIISPNRVLSKMDITEVIDAIKKTLETFEVKKVAKAKEATFENKVIVICSGAELDVRDYIAKENQTGVTIEVRDIQVDKKDLDFKKPTEATIEYKVTGKKLVVDVKDYYSPLLMKRLELENEQRLSLEERVNVFDYRQAIEHVVIDVNYGEGQKSKSISFNAEIFAHKEKKTDLVATLNEYEYEKKGTYTVAVKIVDVLGEEYFETHEVTVK
jgi:DNA modification methylase